MLSEEESTRMTPYWLATLLLNVAIGSVQVPSDRTTSNVAAGVASPIPTFPIM